MIDKQPYRCIYCKSEILLDARKCVECGAFQSEWKNNLTYLAQITGLIALVFSAIVFIVNSLPDLKRTLWWNDSVAVLLLNPNEIVLANTGDGDLFIEALEIVQIEQGGGKSTTTKPIAKQITSGHILEYAFPEESHPNKNNYEGTTVAGGDLQYRETQEEIIKHIIQGGKCYKLNYYEADNPQYLQVKAHYARRKTSGPMTIPHEAVIHAYSMKLKQNFSTPFAIVAMVFHIQSPECESPPK